MDVCCITVRRCAIEIVESATGDRVMHRLPAHGDPKSRPPSYLKIRHGSSAGVHQPAESGPYRWRWNGWCASAAADVGAAVPWSSSTDTSSSNGSSGSSSSGSSSSSSGGGSSSSSEGATGSKRKEGSTRVSCPHVSPATLAALTLTRCGICHACRRAIGTLWMPSCRASCPNRLALALVKCNNRGKQVHSPVRPTTLFTMKMFPA